MFLFYELDYSRNSSLTYPLYILLRFLKAIIKNLDFLLLMKNKLGSQIESFHVNIMINCIIYFLYQAFNISSI